jgi:hypothetical protein
MSSSKLKPLPLGVQTTFSFSDIPDELAPALLEIRNAAPSRFTDSSGDWTIQFIRERTDTEPATVRTVIGEDRCVRIAYSTKALAFRALGELLGDRFEFGKPEERARTRSFQTLGAMIDLSRNGVLKLDAIQRMMRYLALMGYNRVLLYMEDTYEIPGEPVFGYFRGGYSQADLKAIDDYADQFGQEVVPCIQTLGHLEQMLQWPGYAHLRDTDGVLLAGARETNKFVEKMIRAASAPFRSDRIHVGMDEAHGIGSGIYRLRNGLRPPFEILCEHLEQTVATCRRLKLKPMIWSDMFFRLGSETNNYYDRESKIPSEVMRKIPADVQLVYWDYYHTDKEFYDEWIQRHLSLQPEPAFAGGIWTWQRFWAQLPFSLATLRAGVESARKAGLKDAFVTMWGDDGMECDLFSTLPALQCFADQAYGLDVEDEDELEARFRGTVGGSFKTWLACSELDQVPVESEGLYEANVSKWLLWHDPLLNHFELQILPEFEAHFVAIADKMEALGKMEGADAQIEIVRSLARVLALKTHLHLHLRPLYRRGDTSGLKLLLGLVRGQLRDAVVELARQHEIKWHENNRCFGWEVVERRYAGLLSRLGTLGDKLEDFLAGRLDQIPELECEPVQVWPHKRTQSTTISHRMAAGPSFLG